jgi:SpoVK/Ycf46/Vps4 family AAA+-type ATPase
MLNHLWNWTCGIEPPQKFEDKAHRASAHIENQNTRILWLYGPAGAGKSAIAQSLCQQLEAESRVAASFFFKRGHASRGNASRLFATIAYQLVVLLPELNSIISHIVDNDPAVVHKSFSVQLEKLIIEPCRRANPTRPPVIIIDGLDECEGRDVQEEILRSFGNYNLKNPLPVYLLIASRPELHIREIF